MTTRTQAWAVEDYGPVEGLTLIDAPVPDPGEGELVVDVEAMALNPLDLKIMTGQMKAFMPAAMPYTPGSDLVGRVIEAGAGAPARVGDRLVASTWNGALARRALLPATAHVATAPPLADASDLAALPMAGLTALDILRRLGDVTGRRIAVVGATGGVGLALLQIAAQAGAHVIASATPEDADLVRINGAAESHDYRGGDFINAVRRAHPAGVDVVVDLVSMFDALLHSAAALRDGGVLLSTLFGPEPSAFGDRVTADYVRLKAQPGDLDRLVQDYAAGRLRANVARRFAFADAPAAYRALRDGPVRGKLTVALQP